MVPQPIPFVGRAGRTDLPTLSSFEMGWDGALAGSAVPPPRRRTGDFCASHKPTQRESPPPIEITYVPHPRLPRRRRSEILEEAQRNFVAPTMESLRWCGGEGMSLRASPEPMAESEQEQEPKPKRKRGRPRKHKPEDEDEEKQKQKEQKQEQEKDQTGTHENKEFWAWKEKFDNETPPPPSHVFRSPPPSPRLNSNTPDPPGTPSTFSPASSPRLSGGSRDSDQEDDLEDNGSPRTRRYHGGKVGRHGHICWSPLEADDEESAPIRSPGRRRPWSRLLPAGRDADSSDTDRDGSKRIRRTPLRRGRRRQTCRRPSRPAPDSDAGIESELTEISDAEYERIKRDLGMLK